MTAAEARALSLTLALMELVRLVYREGLPADEACKKIMESEEAKAIMEMKG